MGEEERIAGDRDRLIEIIWNYQTLSPRSLLKNIYIALYIPEYSRIPSRFLHRYCILWIDVGDVRRKKFVSRYSKYSSKMTARAMEKASERARVRCKNSADYSDGLQFMIKSHNFIPRISQASVKPL